MKKCYVRIIGDHVREMMETMRSAGIPFVLANDEQHTGSRVTIEEWDNEYEDNLIILIRQCDRELVNLCNTDCVITDYHNGGRVSIWRAFVFR